MKRVIAVLAMVVALATASVGLAQDQNIVDLASGNEDLSTLTSLIEAAGLGETLSGEGPFTVFAPTNDAFNALPPAAVAYLQNNPDVLTNVLTYHVTEGMSMSGDLSEGEVTSLFDGNTVDVRPGEDVVRINDARVTQADVEANNGVVHVINTVLIPPVFEVPQVDPLSVSGDIVAAGSSTVFPLSQRMADLFEQQGYTGNLSVQSIGSGAGFERFCIQGETDLSNASRPINTEERTACHELENPRYPTPFQVATDALAITVNTENDFVDSLSFEDLQAIFSDQANTWSELNSEWPDETIQLYAPGTDSGTYDFFVETVLNDNEELIQNAPNAEFSEDDNVLVQGVEGSPFGIGFFGFAYFDENRDSLKPIAIEGVIPSQETGSTGEYPLSRPLFVYADPEIMQNDDAVASFVAFFLNNANDQLGTGGDSIAYIPTNDYVQARNAFIYHVLMNVDSATIASYLGMNGG